MSVLLQVLDDFEFTPFLKSRSSFVLFGMDVTSVMAESEDADLSLLTRVFLYDDPFVVQFEPFLIVE